MIKIGDLVDQKYHVIKKIGQGGMSTVFLVQDNRLQKEWALKTIKRSILKNGEIFTQSLLSEVEILKKIEHPSIPRIVDVFEDEHQISIVLDLVTGNSLDQIVEVSGPFTQELTLQVGLQVCDTLNYLHSLQDPIIYRDLKPSNLVLGQNGKIRIVDFGIARVLKKEKVEDTICLGTRGYAAPEQYGGSGQSDKRTDVYCLGVTLYHLLTGHNPSSPPYEISPIRKLKPHLSRELEKIILKATKTNPNDRYQDCNELKKALENYKKEDVELIRSQQKLLLIFMVTFIIFLISTISVYLNEHEVIKTIRNDFFIVKNEISSINIIKNFKKFTKKIDFFLRSNGL
ncbi:MAG: serine/threonine protein kinase [Bacillales bacterium]|jgi:serine/threonine-protein kinase|nr:serine/threonine protein kinase [Bacillales bacterium]